MTNLNHVWINRKIEHRLWGRCLICTCFKHSEFLIHFYYFWSQPVMGIIFLKKNRRFVKSLYRLWRLTVTNLITFKIVSSIKIIILFSILEWYPKTSINVCQNKTIKWKSGCHRGHWILEWVSQNWFFLTHLTQSEIPKLSRWYRLSNQVTFF